MLPEIVKAYLDGRVILLLGAGASLNSTDASGQSLPLSTQLAPEIAAAGHLDFAGEDLSVVYSAAMESDADAVHNLLTRRLLHTKPGNDLIGLLRYRWSRIYTLNIDNAVEQAARTSPQKLRVFGREDSLVE